MQHDPAEMQTTLPQGFRASRLDAALALLFPGMGLRGRRRLCESGSVLVNGKPARPSRKVFAGDELRVLGPSLQDGSGGSCCGIVFVPDVIARNARFAALLKPAGMHSEGLAGGGGMSLESGLAAALPGFASPRLLNRLDCATSGLVMAAANGDAESEWSEHQDAGRIDKRYLAVVCGACGGSFAITGRILSSNPRMVRTAEEPDPDPRRHTFVRAIAAVRPGDLPEFAAGLPRDLSMTLVECRIAKGARHQIRAHLASAGLPILGDIKYGGVPILPSAGALAPKNVPGVAPAPPDAHCPGGERFLLHHWRIAFPGFSAESLPEWMPGNIPSPAAETN